MKTIVLLALLAGLTACNTVEGVGLDIADSARAVRGLF